MANVSFLALLLSIGTQMHRYSGNQNPADELTWREVEVLLLLSERLTNREIADRLHLAESTVKDYVGNILAKLYVKNRRQAVERARNLGLLEGAGKSGIRPSSNLPAEPTLFIGRHEELAEIRGQLQSTRLLTLTGPGGIGKTRLALKTAEALASEYLHGACFVSLAPISSSSNIIQAVCEAVSFPLATHEDPQLQLLRYLRKKELLLVMDNFEHLLDGVAIVSEIVRAAPKVKILVTSRERLNLQSETNIIVEGMSFPRVLSDASVLGRSKGLPVSGQAFVNEWPNNDAISLFVQSARKVLAGYSPSPGELAKITKICQSVEGMPLAIELAAAWLQILSVDDIERELDKGLDILVTEVRDRPDRHRSIRAVFDYSWSLLPESEQEIFLLLSIFRGGFTRDAAQQLSGASLQILAGLVNKSFLSHDPGSGRLEIHELLRQYAQDRLEAKPEIDGAIRNAHAAYYADFLHHRGKELRTHRQMAAITEIDGDIENIRTAWRYYIERRNSVQIDRFLFGLWQLHWIRGWNLAGTQTFGEAKRALQGQTGEQSEAALALTMAFEGYYLGWLGFAEEGYELARQSVVLLERLAAPERLLFALDSLLINAYFLQRYTQHWEAINKMLKIAAELDDPWLTTMVYYAASLGAVIRGDYDEARRLAEANLKINEKIGDMFGWTTSLVARGHSAFASGAYEEAKEFYRRSLVMSKEINFHYSRQTSSKYLGKVNLTLGRIAEAEAYLVESLTLTMESGFVRDSINLLYEFARLRLAQGKLDQAAELLSLVLQHPGSQETRMFEGRIGDSARLLLADVEAELSPDSFAAAVERGRRLDVDSIVSEILEPASRS